MPSSNRAVADGVRPGPRSALDAGGSGGDGQSHERATTSSPSVRGDLAGAAWQGEAAAGSSNRAASLTDNCRSGTAIDRAGQRAKIFRAMSNSSAPSSSKQKAGNAGRLPKEE